MGRSQSQSAAAASAINESDETSKQNSNSNSNSDSQSSSMESLLSEALAYGDSGDESIEAKAQKALECPCIADLRKGTCGSQFSEAFLCFLKSTAEEKGSDCVHPFVALQSCIKANPDAFSKDITEDDQVKAKEESPAKNRIHPPTWALESSSPKPRL